MGKRTTTLSRPINRCGGRCLVTIAFAVSILVVGTGAFFLGTVFARPIGNGGVERANLILEKAKRNVTPPVLPPAPAGHTVADTQTIHLGSIGGFGGGFGGTVRIPITKLVGATPEETAKWQSEVDKLQNDYEKRLHDEARNIANEMFVNDWRSALVLFKAYSTDVIIPFLAALAGIVGAVVTLARAFRSKPTES